VIYAEAVWIRTTSFELNRNCPLNEIMLAITATTAAPTVLFVVMFMFRTLPDAVSAASLVLLRSSVLAALRFGCLSSVSWAVTSVRTRLSKVGDPPG
jgi:hypothetical protein